MRIYLTERRIGEDGLEGKRIHANSWEEAVEQAKQIGVEVVGILQDEHTYYEPV